MIFWQQETLEVLMPCTSASTLYLPQNLGQGPQRVLVQGRLWDGSSGGMAAGV